MYNNIIMVQADNFPTNIKLLIPVVCRIDSIHHNPAENDEFVFDDDDKEIVEEAESDDISVRSRSRRRVTGDHGQCLLWDHVLMDDDQRELRAGQYQSLLTDKINSSAARRQHC